MQELSPLSHGPFPAKRYCRCGTLHNSASSKQAAAHAKQLREPSSTPDPNRPWAPAAAKTALESQYGAWEQPALII